jgi:hypothetical protein
MGLTLIDTLKALPSNSREVLDLYPQLYAGTFIVAVKPGTEVVFDSAEFLTYPASGGVRELPVFTDSVYLLSMIPSDAVLISVPGAALWSRLVDVVRSKKCEAAIDPGQKHGIRLNREMILGMIATNAT